MRRIHCQINEQEEMVRILASTNVGRMATLDAQGYPYITPVNFVYHRGRVYFHSSPKGEKLDNLARNPKVGFEVDLPLAYIEVAFNEAGNPCNTHQCYRSVIIRGTASIVTDGELKLAALNALVAKHEGHGDFPRVRADNPEFKACAVIEIKPESMTGKADFMQNKPKDGRRREVADHLARRGRPADLETVRGMGFDLAGGPETGWRVTD
ncbi:MAG: pyridoxamine 5'-phosphate oxidase family protein [Thermodesulfobacteriota bacterium]